MSIKTCSRCYVEKPLSQFYLSKFNKDGHDGVCIECKKQYSQTKYKTKNLVSFKEVSFHKKYWLQDNKLRATAHRKVSYAIKKGELIRQPCEKCEATDHVVAHHEDYTKPLDVVWLCKYQHKERHLEIDKENNNKPKPDMVNHPPHYTHGGIETIAYIRAKLSPEEYVGYLRGSIFKYESRIGLKGDAKEDAGKVKWFADEQFRFLTEG